MSPPHKKGNLEEFNFVPLPISQLKGYYEEGNVTSLGDPAVMQEVAPAPVYWHNIPKDLQDLKQWICWKAVWRNNKWDKVPYVPTTGHLASVTDPATWTDFQTACSYAHNYSGIGFVLQQGNGLVIIDLDNKADKPATPEELSFFTEIYSNFDTYSEVSASGRGLHIVCRAAMPGGKGRRVGNVELYSSERYMVFTGNINFAQVPNIVPTGTQVQMAIKDCQAEIAQLLQRLGLNAKTGAEAPSDSEIDVLETKTLDEILSGFEHWENHEKFKALWNGSWQGAYRSQSEADMALIEFFRKAGATMSQCRTLFAASALHPSKRPAGKGKGATYVDDTIRAAYTIGCQEEQEEKVRIAKLKALGFGAQLDGTVASIAPVDIFANLKPPAFKLSLVPDIIANFARDESEIAGIDPVAIAMPCLVACASAIDDRIQIRVKSLTTNWFESARLWVAILGAPSTMKTFGMSLALKTTKAINSAQIKSNAELEEAWKNDCEVAKAGGGIAPEKPLLQRATISDATVEKISDILSRTEPRGILLDKDELNGWLQGMDAYKGKGGNDLQFWLEGYNGGGKPVDRIGRGTIDVQHIGISIVGGIQPEVLNAYTQTSNHDGLLPRLLVFPCRDRKFGIDRVNNWQFSTAYENLIRWLYSLPPAESYYVEQSAEAHKVRDRLQRKLMEIEMVLPNKFAKAAVGKWQGTYARILLVYHCIDCYQRDPTVHPLNVEVKEATALMVEQLFIDMILVSTLSFYSSMDPTDNLARQIGTVILAMGWTRFTEQRDFNQYFTAWRKETDNAKITALNIMEAYGWIQPEPGRLNSRGRPIAYLVNPAVHVLYAERAQEERRKREALRSLMQDMRKNAC